MGYVLITGASHCLGPAGLLGSHWSPLLTQTTLSPCWFFLKDMLLSFVAFLAMCLKSEMQEMLGRSRPTIQKMCVCGMPQPPPCGQTSSFHPGVSFGDWKQGCSCHGRCYLYGGSELLLARASLCSQTVSSSKVLGDEGSVPICELAKLAPRVEQLYQTSSSTWQKGRLFSSCVASLLTSATGFCDPTLAKVTRIPSPVRSVKLRTF